MRTSSEGDGARRCVGVLSKRGAVEAVDLLRGVVLPRGQQQLVGVLQNDGHLARHQQVAVTSAVVLAAQGPRSWRA